MYTNKWPYFENKSTVMAKSTVMQLHLARGCCLPCGHLLVLHLCHIICHDCYHLVSSILQWIDGIDKMFQFIFGRHTLQSSSGTIWNPAMALQSNVKENRFFFKSACSLHPLSLPFASVLICYWGPSFALQWLLKEFLKLRLLDLWESIVWVTQRVVSWKC